MPTTTAGAASGRLLSLLSLLQTRRDWPGGLLADRLGISERTVRRDVDRLRELGYPIQAVKGPDGGYRMEAGSRLPPLLFDDDQAVALAVALRTAVASGAGVEEGAARALITLRQVLPSRLQGRVQALESAIVVPPSSDVDPETLLAVGSAIRACEELRFDYDRPGTQVDDRPARRAQPHHLLARAGRWYVVAWDSDREDWRTYRVDRIRLRIPNGPRFTPREVPGGDVREFVEARFKGAEQENRWACHGSAVVHAPAADVLPFAHDGVVEPLDDHRCRLRQGSYSWGALASSFTRFDADLSDVEPAELRDAFTALADRARRAAQEPQTSA